MSSPSPLPLPSRSTLLTRTFGGLKFGQTIYTGKLARCPFPPEGCAGVYVDGTLIKVQDTMKFGFIGGIIKSYDGSILGVFMKKLGLLGCTDMLEVELKGIDQGSGPVTRFKGDLKKVIFYTDSEIAVTNINGDKINRNVAHIVESIKSFMHKHTVSVVFIRSETNRAAHTLARHAVTMDCEYLEADNLDQLKKEKGGLEVALEIAEIIEQDADGVEYRIKRKIKKLK